MSETRYMISDTAKQVEVEAHVLRYWEEELELPISRNEMGHRYYTAADIRLFKNIKELKEQGFQLKAIKILLPDLRKSDGKNLDNLLTLKEELNNKVSDIGMKEVAVTVEGTSLPSSIEETSIDKGIESENKMQQFQMILGNIFQQVLEDNNKELGREVSSQVSDSVIKEMDYLMRIKDEREEDRYKRLDETIRTFQKTRQEIAATSTEVSKKRKRRFFRKTKKHTIE